MTVSDVVCSAIKILGNSDLYEYISKGGSGEEVYDNDKELLLIAYNQAIEVAVNYCPLVYTESFSPLNGVVKYQNFKFNPYKILKVKPLNGSCEVEILPTEIKTTSQIAVEYVYLPTATSLQSPFVYEFSPLSLVDVAYGVLSEYLIYVGRFEEASAYFDKFITAVKNASGIKKAGKLSQRLWF